MSKQKKKYTVNIHMEFDERPTEEMIMIENFGEAKIKTVKKLPDGMWLANIDLEVDTLAEVMVAMDDGLLSGLVH